MAWKEVIGQARVAKMLGRAIETDRVAHAYLFHGPDGVGKRAMALEFARALECERGLQDACGTCGPCRKVSRLVHPDVHVLFPYPNETSAEDIAERMRLLAANPYEELDYVRRPTLSDSGKPTNKQVLYPIRRIHEELRHALSFRSHEGRYKVAVLIDADALRTEASNALLKVLEEPARRTVFILTTARAEKLLPTIVSRCQQVRFEPLSVDEIRAALMAKLGVDEKAADLQARMADGSVTRAFRLAENPELIKHRNMVVDLFRQVYMRRDGAVIDIVESFAGLAREQVKGILHLMLQWVRDIMLARDLRGDAYIANKDLTESVGRFVGNIPDANLESMTAAIEQAQWLVERNVNLTLLLLNLADALGKAMLGESLQGLTVSLIDSYTVGDTRPGTRTGPTPTSG